MTHFTTEFGNAIPFVDDYFERNKFHAYFAKAEKSRPQAVAITIGGEPDSLPITSLLKDLVQFSGIIQFLKTMALLSHATEGSILVARRELARGFISGTGRTNM